MSFDIGENEGREKRRPFRGVVVVVVVLKRRMEGEGEWVRRGEGRGGKEREEQSTQGTRDSCALLGAFQEQAASFSCSNFTSY